jgi:hypothetical protein
MKRLVQIRSYQLEPDATVRFHRVFLDECVPMLRQAGHDVVAFGPSLHQADAYYLVRAYDDLADLNTRQDAFYGSPRWREGPREAVLALIDRYLDTVLWLSAESIEDLRHGNAGPTAPP